MKYDKINGDVGFLEGPHKYINLKDSSIQYISVTTLIEKYGKPLIKNLFLNTKLLKGYFLLIFGKKKKEEFGKDTRFLKIFQKYIILMKKN